MEGISWDTLPSLPLLEILSYLSLNDLLTVSLVNRHWLSHSEEDSVWKKFTSKTWLISSLPGKKEGETFKRIYIEYAQTFGKYRSCYAKVFGAWQRITDWLKDNAPAILDTLNQGLTEDQMDQIEKNLKYTLPLDLRLSYRFYNGQSLDLGKPLRDGLFGGYEFYDYHVNFWLQRLDKVRSNKNCLLLVMSYNGAAGWYVDLNTGKVVSTGDSSRSMFLLANSWGDFLEEYATDLVTENYTLDSSSLSILRFPAKKGVSEETTRGVKVHVSPLFVPEQSREGRYFFAYRITLSMKEDSPPEWECKLTTRHWIIEDQTGKKEEVRGPGVVGEYPRMYPGAVFSYASCCPLKTPTGSMKGTFQMAYIVDQQIRDLVVPQFFFKAYPSV